MDRGGNIEVNCLIQRAEEWQSHLGTSHLLTPHDLNQLAATADLSGGTIRNKEFAAAVPTHAEGLPSPTPTAEALGGAFLKLGRQMPVELARA